jgi:ribosomal protein S20
LAKTPRKWTGARSPSGLKRVRQAERRRAVLQPRRTEAKTLTSKALVIATTTPDGADPRVALAEAISALDRAAKAGAIHPNAAARRKSRLTLKVNAVLGGEAVQTSARLTKMTGKAAAKARIAASKATKAKGAQTAAGKARAALAKTTRAEAATEETVAPAVETAAPAKATKAPSTRTTKASASKASTAKTTAKPSAAKASAAGAKAAPKAASRSRTTKAASGETASKPSRSRAKKTDQESTES